MNQHKPPQAMSLLDLIGRSWDLGSGVRQLLFNRDHSSILAVLQEGRLAFLRLQDAEDPDTRMRTDLETGRATIRPREKLLPQPVVSEAGLIAGDVRASALGDSGFAFASATGAQLWRATARGQTLRDNAGGGVTALAGLPGGDDLLVACGARLERQGAHAAAIELGHAVSCISVSPDAAHLACAGPGKVSILDPQTLKVMAAIGCEGALAALSWSPDGRWLVAGAEDKALVVIDLHAARADRIIGFPAPVRSVDFSAKAGALIAAGAFRTVGWKLPDLPFGGHEGTPIETGKPGLTLVETVAAHPSRDLCATGYANGLVTICQIGIKHEMMLREGDGAPVTALAWSADGKHLAIGTASEDSGDNSGEKTGGKAAIVTFPKHMFK